MKLKAISPIDGRYGEKTKEFPLYFSEQALIGYRTSVEINYLLALAKYAKEKGGIQIPELTEKQISSLKEFRDEIAHTDEHAALVKVTEKTTNHDVKAVEYVIRQTLSREGFPKELIAHCHFGLTSEDVNNIAYAHMMHNANHEIILPVIEDVANDIHTLAHKYAATGMISRTHGQPATPTTFGKEMMIFVKRLNAQLHRLRSFRFSVKLNGPSGNYNGHYAAYPEVDWPQFVQEFIDTTYQDKLENKPFFTVNHWTNQIEDHDTYTEFFNIFQEINCILLKFCTDMWLYISNELVKQKKVEGEVGSSAMPHKVNPIDFENAEGNIHVANALFEVFCRKLPHSRLQRDLSDSTIERNFGVAFGHSLIAYRSIEKGLKKIAPDQGAMARELDGHPELLSEAYQLVLKKHGIEDAYEKLKNLTRGERVTLQEMHAFLDEISIPDSERERLKELTPSTYLGLAPRLALGFPVADPNWKLKDI